MDEVVVVTGYHHAEIEPAVETFPVTVVRNPNPEAGQQSSVRLGLEALGTKYPEAALLAEYQLFNKRLGQAVGRLVVGIGRHVLGELHEVTLR